MSLRRMLEKQEHEMLHPAAAFSDQSLGRTNPEKACTVRPAFQHDRDKILHCKSFRCDVHQSPQFPDELQATRTLRFRPAC